MAPPQNTVEGEQLTIRVPTSEFSTGEAIWPIVDELRRCPPHAWRCPVTMKLDPNRVAWTCAGCGAIATTDAPEMTPD